MDTKEKRAKARLDDIIKKSRVHMYKPIQVAEILYRDRAHRDINLAKLDSYRNASKIWRDDISKILVGNTSTSSSRFQDNLFAENALPPSYLSPLGDINRRGDGIIENYIYVQLLLKLSQLIEAFSYCKKSKDDFDLDSFINLFWAQKGLKRSIDKVYEAIVYALFSTLVDALEINVTVSLDSEKNLLFREFEDFAEKVIFQSRKSSHFSVPAKIFRVGVTNAADRGLDMWANFGLALQVKHLSLTEDVAEDVVSSISADRIVIVCKDVERDVILSLLTQIGWRAKIQSIITESDLKGWYHKALKGRFSDRIAADILSNLRQQMEIEFPSVDEKKIDDFFSERGYHRSVEISDDF